MTRQTISGLFPAQSQFIAQDFLGNLNSAGLPQLTLGAAAVAQPGQVSSGITTKATLLSWSVSAYLGFCRTAATDVLFGKLGKIQAGLSRQAIGIIRGANSQPWSVALPAAPQDATLIEDLWDPASDPLPPSTLTGTPGAPNALLPLSASQALPVPLELDPGALPFIGIWLFPSLLGFTTATFDYAGLGLLYGSWTLNYDDGLTG